MTVEYVEVPSTEGWTSFFIPVGDDLYIETDRAPETEQDMTAAKLLSEGVDPETGEIRATRPMLAHKRWVRDLERADWVQEVIFH